MPGFLGRHEYQIDAKGRVSLPSAFRRVVSSYPMVLMQWQDTHLDLFPQETWADIQKNLLTHKRAKGDKGAYLRRFTGRAVEVEPDTHGRIRIPPLLRQGVGLEDSVAFVGALDRIELWPPERFEEHLRAADEDDDEFAAPIFG